MQDYNNPNGGDGGGRFGSPHVSGTLCLFGDGRVGRVRHSVQGDIFHALCLINDGRSISDSDYE